jgi:hypothetical protein
LPRWSFSTLACLIPRKRLEAGQLVCVDSQEALCEQGL